MRLLVITQKVDQTDDVLGFMHRWIQEFALHCEQVTVICLYEGQYSLPSNVRVFSLGKERSGSRFSYLVNFYRFIVRERNSYDTIFVHMNQLYVLLGGLFWRFTHKKIALWYAHGHVPFSLRLVEKITHVILTSTRSGFRLPSNKVRVIGQGIDTSFFSPGVRTDHVGFVISIIGRISPVKDYETLIGAVALIKDKIPELVVHVVGGAGLPEQEVYLALLKQRAIDQGVGDIVNFVGAMANTKIIQILQQTDVFANTSHTGSLDKAVLEAMSCGVPILTCNEALEEVLGTYTKQLMFPKKNRTALAEKIEGLYAIGIAERSRLGAGLRAIVIQDHSISQFVEKIIKAYE